MSTQYTRTIRDVTCHNFRSTTTNKIARQTTLPQPIAGSIIAIKSGALYNLFYADGVTWFKLTGSGSAPPLSSVLAIGNTTGANDIIVDNGQSILGEDVNSGLLRVLGGNAVSDPGEGGTVSVAAGTGDGDTGGILLLSGGNSTGGDGGPAGLRGGNGETGGLVLIEGGAGSVSSGGDLSLIPGDGFGANGVINLGGPLIAPQLITDGPSTSGVATGNDVCGSVDGIATSSSQVVGFAQAYPGGTVINVLLTVKGSTVAEPPHVSGVTTSGFTINNNDGASTFSVYYFVIAHK